MKKTYFTVAVLIFTIVGAVLSGFLEWIAIDDTFYYIQLAIFTLASLSVILLVVFILPELIPSYFKTAQKTTIFFLLFALVCCLATAKFAIYTHQYELSFFNMLLFKFLGLEILVVLGALLLFRTKSNDTIVQSSVISPGEFEAPKEQLTINGELLNEQLTLAVEELLYIKSSDNYSEFYFNTPDGIQNKLMRMTLKSVEEQIPYDYMIRSHKSYIVNMAQVKSITGNANNAQLHFKDHDLSLPVSRSRREVAIRALATLLN